MGAAAGRRPDALKYSTKLIAATSYYKNHRWCVVKHKSSGPHIPPFCSAGSVVSLWYPPLSLRYRCNIDCTAAALFALLHILALSLGPSVSARDVSSTAACCALLPPPDHQ